jgi:hypothetical protein
LRQKLSFASSAIIDSHNEPKAVDLRFLFRRDRSTFVAIIWRRAKTRRDDPMRYY